MIYVLDTNIILTNPSLSQYKGKTVYIPIEVMRELDNQKSREGVVGFKSRLFHRKLKEVDGLKEDTYDFDGVTVLNPTTQLEDCSLCSNEIKIADDWFVNSFILKEDEYVAHTSDFSCYNLMRLNGQNCEYIPQQTKDDYSKLTNSYTEVYVKGEVLNNLNLFDRFEEFGCMDYLLLINSSDPTKKRLVKIRKGRLHHVESHSPYGVKHKNIEQQILIDSLMDKEVKIVVLSARQGCGKSFLGLACGLEHVVNKRNYSRILLAKSQAPLSRHEEIGWLTGDIDNKLRYSMVNYTSNLEALSNGVHTFEKDGKKVRRDGMKIFEEFKTFGQMDFLPLDSILGASYDDTYVCLDEAQSIDLKTLRSCLTRITDNSKMVIMGDVAQQTDVMSSIDKSGLYLANKYLRNVEGVCVLTLSEIERGSVCRNVAEALDKIEILG
ncbi:MAG: PhoH family protein [Clostridium sp.]|uniref:PhoH family protein n=1 Tax=Clostridium sp. TaxID=1506 RepID=UPI003EE639D8